MTENEKAKMIALHDKAAKSAKYWWARYEAQSDETSLRGADQAQGRLEEITDVLAVLKIKITA